MNKVNKLTLTSSGYPDSLRHIPHQPAALYVQGDPAVLSSTFVAVVGTRKITAYGHTITRRLVGQLVRSGIGIASGLALGVDAAAHEAALEAGGCTIAVLPGGLDMIYPAHHRSLARRILESGGALVSEYPFGTRLFRSHFIARNRIVAGLSRAVLIPEAGEKSGTLHTVRFALEQGKDVLAIPGNITSTASAGTNNLIKTGATPITCTADMFFALGMSQQAKNTQPPRGDSPAEQAILNALAAGEHDGERLLRQSLLGVDTFNQTMTLLELRGILRPLGADKWTLTV